MENVVGETALSFDMKLREKTALQHHLDFKAHIFIRFFRLNLLWMISLAARHKNVEGDVHTLTARHRNIWNSCKDKVYLKIVLFCKFFKFNSRDGFPERYIFIPDNLLFN